MYIVHYLMLYTPKMHYLLIILIVISYAIETSLFANDVTIWVGVIRGGN